MTTLVIGNKALSSWSMRPWVMMRTLGLTFDERLIRLDEPETRASIKDESPSGLVPCLIEEDGTTVWDSLAILEYLNDTRGGVWPEDGALRVHARCASAEMHSGFSSLRGTWPMDLTTEGARLAVPFGVRRDLARIFTLWSEALSRSAGPFLYGEFCGADAMFAPVVTRIKTYGPVAMPKACEDYLETVWTCPAVTEWRAGAAKEIEAGWYPR
ncbi:glutathione S-transferase family protein [Parvularcula dongshanensis]|uniref:Glutathione S-transferase n=1 Tax=Parvularcula dongshanensis TaxID=1173995 RepID=A0A840I1B6_9PROT|nr:glutathione S-transferase family protein [Parvularcula dongshanensis]MBB4658836.1 glutathione S-transferase [Parvularcula dongshanensis]